MDKLTRHPVEIWTQKFRPLNDSSAPDVNFSVYVCVCTCAASGSFFDKVSQLTVADEGAFGVLTFTMETDVWVQITFIHIWADGDEQTQVTQES